MAHLAYEDEDNDAASTETLIKHHEDFTPHFRHQKRRWTIWKSVALHITAIAVYGILATLATIHITSKNSHRSDIVYCKDFHPVWTNGLTLRTWKHPRTKQSSTKSESTIHISKAIWNILGRQATRSIQIGKSWCTVGKILRVQQALANAL